MCQAVTDAALQTYDAESQRIIKKFALGINKALISTQTGTSRRPGHVIPRIVLRRTERDLDSRVAGRGQPQANHSLADLPYGSLSRSPALNRMPAARAGCRGSAGHMDLGQEIIR